MFARLAWSTRSSQTLAERGRKDQHTNTKIPVVLVGEIGQAGEYIYDII